MTREGAPAPERGMQTRALPAARHSPATASTEGFILLSRSNAPARTPSFFPTLSRRVLREDRASSVREGEIFRYQVGQRQWLPSFKTSPGLRSIRIDNHNGLLFAWNYFQGYIEIMDLDSGKHISYILANAMGRYINLDVLTGKAILNTHGFGPYQIDYQQWIQPHAAQ